MDVRVTPIDPLLTIHKSAVTSIFLHFVHGRYQTARSWNWEWVEMVKWNGPFRSNRSNREKWSTSKGGPVFSKLSRLDRTDPFTFRPTFPEILVEWIAPKVYHFSRLDQSNQNGPFHYIWQFRPILNPRTSLFGIFHALFWIENSRCIGVTRTSMYRYDRSVAASQVKGMFWLLTPLEDDLFPERISSFDSNVVF